MGLFAYKLERADGTPAEPATLTTAVPTWQEGDTIPLGKDRILRVIGTRDGETLDDDAVLIVEETATVDTLSPRLHSQPMAPGYGEHEYLLIIQERDGTTTRRSYKDTRPITDGRVLDIPLLGRVKITKIIEEAGVGRMGTANAERVE
jgi:hypothetical protein